MVRPSGSPPSENVQAAGRRKKRSNMTVPLPTGPWVGVSASKADMITDMGVPEIDLQLLGRIGQEGLACAIHCRSAELVEGTNCIGSCRHRRQQTIASQQAERRAQLATICGQSCSLNHALTLRETGIVVGGGVGGDRGSAFLVSQCILNESEPMALLCKHQPFPDMLPHFTSSR